MFDIKEYEAMAMLALTDDERERLDKRARALIDGFGVLDAVDTEGAAPLVTVLDLSNIMRDDISEKRFTREEILDNAPARHGGFFQVPGTLA